MNVYKDFLKEFLPAADQFRRSGKTDFGYIYSSLYLVFLHYFDEKLHPDIIKELLNEFYESKLDLNPSGYNEYYTKFDGKRVLLSQGDLYYGIKPEALMMLRNSTRPISDNTSQEKRKLTERLRTEILQWVKSRQEGMRV